MAIRDLLVAFDANPPSVRALRFAAQMAVKYDASVTGLHVYRQEKFESHIRRWIPDDVIDNLQASTLEAEKAVEAAFYDTLKTCGFSGRSNWIAAPGNPDVLLPRYVRYFDMLIAGQFSGGNGGQGGSVNPEELLLRSGKPIVVVPKNYEQKPFTETAAVAWDASRSAARALTDAMQILETKHRLDVIRLISSEDDEAKRVLPEHDLIAHLKAHGINAELVQINPKGRSAGETILAHCDATQPDVLVMGAFGRGKFGTILFGSTAQHVLKNMTIPVLMSH